MRSALLLAFVVVFSACPGAPTADGGAGGGAGGGTAYDSGFFPILPPGIEGQANTVVPTGAGDVYAIGNGTADGGNAALMVVRVKADRTLDPTWGTNGVSLVDLADGPSVGITQLAGDTGYAALVDGDALYVVGTAQALLLPGAGEKVVLAKFLASGALDTTFGNTGATTGVRLDGFTGTTASATALLKQPDGKLLVGGDVQGNFYVTRYLPSGTADVTFSKTPGMGFGAVWGTSRAEQTRSMALDPDGKIVVFGGDAMSAARLLPDGQLDVTFGAAGFFTQPGATGYALWREADGAYLAVGFVSFATDAGDRRLAVRFTKLTAAGVADASFGPDGMREVVLPGTNIGLSSIRGAARLPDGRVMVYLTGLGTTYLARFNADFTLDSTFLENDGLRPLSVRLPLFQPAFNVGNHLTVSGGRFWVGDFTNVTVEPVTPTTKNFFEVISGEL